MDLEYIKNSLEQGKSYNQIALELGVSESTIRYYKKAFNSLKYIQKIKAKSDAKKDYEDLVCYLANNCENINQICTALGKRATNTNYMLIQEILNKKGIDTSHFTQHSTLTKHGRTRKPYTVDEIFIEHSPITNSSKVRQLLLKHGIKLHQCEKCGNTIWNGQQIPLEVHHINGDRTDNRIDNLIMLCPNCHAQTDNFCKKKTIKRKETKSQIKKDFQYRKVQDRPTKRELYDMITTMSFVQIGKKYNVSDNAIRKWCKMYGLPHTKHQLNLENKK